MPTQITSRAALAALLVAGALALGACGSSDNSNDTTSAATTTTPATTATTTSATTTSAASSGSSTVELSADPNGALAFDKTELTAKAGKVTLDMANPESAGIPHAIAIEGNGVDKDGATAQPGGSSTVTVTLEPGKYTFYCPVPGHEAGGMKGTLTVS